MHIETIAAVLGRVRDQWILSGQRADKVVGEAIIAGVERGLVADSYLEDDIVRLTTKGDYVVRANSNLSALVNNTAHDSYEDFRSEYLVRAFSVLLAFGVEQDYHGAAEQFGRHGWIAHLLGCGIDASKSTEPGLTKWTTSGGTYPGCSDSDNDTYAAVVSCTCGEVENKPLGVDVDLGPKFGSLGELITYLTNIPDYRGGISR